MDADQKLHKLLDQLINRSDAYSDTRKMVAAVRKALFVFKGAPNFQIWVEATLKELDNPGGVPFVIKQSQIPKDAKLEAIEHVGPRESAPTIRRWVDDKGDPISLNPTEDFGGSDY